jgi:hypothetical protein
MEIPVQFASSRSAGLRVLVVLALGALMTACASVSAQRGLVGLGLDSSARPAISSGRLTVEVRDENGYTMAGYMVDIGWEEPRFYKTRAFTDRNGRVSFSGVPDVAEVTINHEGGIYQQLLIVPQSGRADLPVMLNTRGGYQARLEADRERLRQQQQAASSR